MSSQGFRFIHASDFRLELPVDGLWELPERYGDAILDTPRAAVERLFSAALKEKVDFVILSGDLLSPRDAGPWAMLFLIEQFKRLESVHIPIYWAAGRTDSPDSMPSAFRFPSNVHIFPVGRVEEVFFSRDGVPLVRLLGTSWGKAGVAPRGVVETSDGSDDLYTIGVFNGKLPMEALKSVSVRYWALGGSRVRETVSQSPSLAIYPGSTLARNFKERGDYGATLVEVSELGRSSATLLRTSPLRWFVETLVVSSDDTEENVLNEARSRLKAMQEKASEEAAYVGRSVDGDIGLVTWRVEADSSVVSAVRHSSVPISILRDLRADFGKNPPVVYSVDMEPVLKDKLPDEVLEQQTILGDYLRMVHYYKENPKESLDLESVMPEDLRAWNQRERIKDEIDERRRAEGESADLTELTAKLDALDSRDFRPEVASLYALTTFDLPQTVESTDDSAAPTVNDERRRKALIEAAALGVDLLSEADLTIGLFAGAPPAKTQPQKNRKIASELRELQKNLDGKEIGS